MKVFIKTLFGLEDILANELKELGADKIEKHRRAVSCEGTLELVYRANYLLRTALKVQIPLYSFQAKDENSLYDKVRDHDWSQYLDIHKTFAINETIFSEYFKHSRYAALKVKDAIVDQFRDKFRQRPSVDSERPDVLFNVHAHKENFTISLDSSGESLNKRGYRAKGHEAPLNEVLASGLLKMTNWNTESPLLDPFCGTGTLLVEAAMQAFNIPAQFKRKEFGFKTWANFSPLLWNKVKEEANAQIRKTSVELWGNDISKDAISQTRHALGALDLRRNIRVSNIHFADQSSRGLQGVIITNPPYGERIGDNVEELYHEFGDFLRQKFKGYDVWVLSSNKKALKQLHLAPEQKFDVLNGKLECEFCQYSIK